MLRDGERDMHNRIGQYSALSETPLYSVPRVGRCIQVGVCRLRLRLDDSGLA